jgi:hemerythrin-like domain-containing protein
MTTISDRIIHDHRELEEYYNTIINATDTDTKTRYGNQFVWELARHSVGEELVVYPAFEHHLGAKGVEMAEDDRREHHQASHVPSDSPALVRCLSLCVYVDTM